MKKIKQLWTILGMVKKFFPRLIREFKDLKIIIDDIKYEWFLNFPPKEFVGEIEGYNPIPEDEDMEPEYTPPPIGVPDGRSYFKKKGKQ